MRKATHERHGEYKTRLYRTWGSMKYRCLNPGHPHYSQYGGRGIVICDEWKESYLAFRKWAMSTGYTDSLEIDRIDVNGNYEPSNCRWATRSQQLTNTRKKPGTTSKYRGVVWCKRYRKWFVAIRVNGGRKSIGRFSSEEDAARAYDAAAKIAHGEFASLNFRETAK